jgi:transposase
LTTNLQVVNWPSPTGFRSARGVHNEPAIGEGAAMAKERISASMQAQIRELKEKGLSIRNIARALGVSRQTVRKYMAASADSVERTVAVVPTNTTTAAWHEPIDWEQVCKEAQLKGATFKQLHQEVAPDVSYWSFWRHMRTLLPKVAPRDISLRREHNVAEKVEIDYADGIDIVDRVTGEVRKTHLFCGVLPFSSYTFGEFVFTQKLESFLDSHDHMWHYFGGVTPYAVVDNLKAGVHKAHRYDPDVNPTYCEYANHTGFAVLPARPFRPRDKASIEAAIGSIQRGFYAEARNVQFYTIDELNIAFRIYLERFNAGVMKDYGVSRAQRFVTEQTLLKPIPQKRFEITEWRTAKVHPDCHIQVLRCFYSVPHEAVGKMVRVRVSSKMIEVFTEDAQPLAVHPRLHGKSQFSTNEDHYPDKKLGIKRFEVRVARTEAQAIGPHTYKLVESLIGADYPLRHLRRIQGILRLVQARHVTVEALEYGCQMALNFNKPRLAYIKSCAEHYQANGARLVLVKPNREPSTLYLHGTADARGEA